MKEQHREQKLFPQLLQLRCRQEPRSVSDASPSPEHRQTPAPLFFPSADPTQGIWDYCGTGEVPRWGRPNRTPSRRLTLFFSTEKVAEQPVQLPEKQRQQLSLNPG